MAVALLVAAGRGERLGSSRPKALVSLAGKPMLEWSVAALRQVAGVTQIVVALPPGELDAAPAGTTAAPGGPARSQSVRAALHAAQQGDPVIVHDAARPLASPDLFRRALEELDARGCDALVAAAPVSDTIKQAGEDGRTVVRTLERSDLWAVQTPQVFRRAVLQRVLFEADERLLATATDDAWLVERAGGTVQLLEATGANVKVTTPIELQLAEILLQG